MKRYFLLALALVLVTVTGCKGRTAPLYRDVTVRGKWFEVHQTYTDYFVSFTNGTSQEVGRDKFSFARPGQSWCLAQQIILSGSWTGEVDRTDVLMSPCPVVGK